MQGTITLKQAWESWRMESKNMALATKSRIVFNDILLSMYGSADLKDFTVQFVRDIFCSSLADKTDQIKAASILVYLLEWGASKGYCQKPDFDEEIPLQCSMLNVQSSEEESEPKKRAGRPMHQVVQLHPDTLEVIKVWDSMREAADALGVKNFDRAIKKHFKAAGFYWCNPGEENTFKAARKRQQPAEKHELVRNPLTLVPEEVLRAPDDTPDIKYELTREEMLEFAKLATYHLDDRLCPLSREELRAEAWLQGYEFVKSHTSKSAAI